MQLNRSTFNGSPVNGRPSLFTILAVRWRLMRPAVVTLLTRAARAVLPRRAQRVLLRATPKNDLPRVSRG